MRTEEPFVQCALSITTLSDYVDEACRADAAVPDKQKLNFALLRYREANRAISVLLRERKRNVQNAKGSLDRTELSRQNLLYEKRHLESTIQDTRHHPSLFRTVLLPSAMLDDEPETIMPHDIMLESLGNELNQRKELADTLKSKQESLELAKSRLVLKRKELEKSRDQLEGVLRAADPFLHSHSRFFVELENAATQLQSKSQSLLSISEDKEFMALETLLQHWSAFCESQQGEGAMVSMYDELEAGEDCDALEKHGDDTEDDEARSASAVGSEDILATRTHARFESQGTRPGRRFPFAYLLVSIPILETSSGQSANLFFYHADQQDRSAPIVVRLETDAEGADEIKTSAEAESILLSLDVDPVMRLTIPHDTVAPGSAGHVPFRWIQSLAGIMPDASFSEPQHILLTFANALRFYFQSNVMQIDNPAKV